jgi:hypothetical protein
LKRELNEKEIFLLEAILPSRRKGYAEFRKRMEHLSVIRTREEDENSLLLGKDALASADFVEITPLFALGMVAYEGKEYYVSIHEPTEDEIVEVEINLENDSSKRGNGVIWSYSDWRPGFKAPGDNSKVREVHLIKNKIVIAIAPQQKRIWVYDSDSGINRLVPVSSFYNEIMRVKEAVNSKAKISPELLFEKLEEFSDEEIGKGFLLYNEYWKKIDLPYEIFKKNTHIKKHFIFKKKLFGKQNVR